MSTFDSPLSPHSDCAASIGLQSQFGENPYLSSEGPAKEADRFGRVADYDGNPAIRTACAEGATAILVGFRRHFAMA